MCVGLGGVGTATGGREWDQSGVARASGLRHRVRRRPICPSSRTRFRSPKALAWCIA
ncbi:hypothetical protein B0H17DRAFT_1087954 [Mycena rosella]|uniref:Uncharacterized protein n=1 Tax=Mycena rosella TaxID=1033263 RepID=A0AAD7G9A2_MYCRO|nr:hypothetical protein B0H17DRAFT_1087954 [Mycena rosella]